MNDSIPKPESEVMPNVPAMQERRCSSSERGIVTPASSIPADKPPVERDESVQTNPHYVDPQIEIARLEGAYRHWQQTAFEKDAEITALQSQLKSSKEGQAANLVLHLDALLELKAARELMGKMASALEASDKSLTTIRNANGTTLNPFAISQEAYHAHECVRAVLKDYQLEKGKA